MSGSGLKPSRSVSSDTPAGREWLCRRDAPMPFQTWRPFPDEAIVCIEGPTGERKTGPAGKFWWGYEQEMGRISDSVIVRARRLDRPLADRSASEDRTESEAEATQ